MPQGSSFRLVAGIAFGLAATASTSFAQSTGTPAQQEPAVANDPYQWLEDVKGDKSIAWVREQNAKSEAELAQSPQFRKLETDVRAILDSTAKIPGVEKIGDYYYNFWKDKNHERGLWRRTTLAEYRKADPKWETILDLDALNAAEKENWVWHGADCLKPDYTRCLVALSRGGSDADVTREFDLASRTWVKDGFFRPEAKGGLGWVDKDTVYVYTDFGPGSMTPSGYPRIVKQWQRGTPLAQAQKVYEGEPQDMYIAAQRDLTPGFQRDFVNRVIAFYNDELFLRDADGKLVKVDAPNSANKSVHKEWLVLELRDAYEAGGTTYAAGSLIATKFDDFMAGKRDFTVLFAPTDNTSLASFGWTKNHLVLNVMEDVKNKLFVLTPAAGEWTRKPLAGAPTIGTVSVAPVDADDSDAVWVTATDYLTPTTLAIADVSNDAAPQTLKSNPQFFDARTHVIEQHFATSKDGTRIPYFLVKPKDAKNDGTTPTLLYGYGGFEVSMTPGYSGGVGKGWLEKGGAYAVANIRGGGEYGPRWHQAALKANRHKAYEDFAAVAEDLVKSGLTTQKRLGIMGGSNGGLLMGNMLVQYPQLFGAIVVQVPLLDMKRYSHLLAGASWMAEYGDPDTADWEFIQSFSPYQLFDPSKEYPPVLFTTSTADDRVHPGHARKMMAKMLEAKKDVRYYENIEGGHGGAANNAQSAHMNALAYTFLWNELSK
ncbi:prolyl oligopeptidase family serine peptidase [Lysobacter sp. A6]|uniref:Prolyl oligopeptidase family serine peptidase n=1 Tax=Noviluteimonas lactosilytica TaxID=2888523 RepID=A0ABS8JH15_9GAMM|nr:prolyl oligopeptidase family serine peptidase [Lysobacter lactosilyticus]MCC8362900.1 prolyl oligopeptidase family serine peptidase [Lysobacter lactosilyticus]